MADQVQVNAAGLQVVYQPQPIIVNATGLMVIYGVEDAVYLRTVGLMVIYDEHPAAPTTHRLFPVPPTGLVLHSQVDKRVFPIVQ